jgi:hypothetical protein
MGHKILFRRPMLGKIDWIAAVLGAPTDLEAHDSVSSSSVPGRYP